MGLCPYCEKEVTLEDFFKPSETLKLKKFQGDEKRVAMYTIKMWCCPHCDKILSISEKKGLS